MFRSEIEERIASRFLGVLEEMSIGADMPNITFRVWKNGQVYDEPPDKFKGVFEAIKVKFAASRTWSLLDIARNQAREAWRTAGRYMDKLKKAERRIQLLETRLRNRVQAETVIDDVLGAWIARMEQRNRWSYVRSEEFRLQRELRDELVAALCDKLPEGGEAYNR